MTSYRLELEGIAPYLQTAQNYIAQAQGYSAEVQARLADDQAKYNWYVQQYQMIDGQYKEEIQILQGSV